MIFSKPGMSRSKDTKEHKDKIEILDATRDDRLVDLWNENQADQNPVCNNRW